MRILVVDDEPSVRDALDRALRMDGYKVELAADGREALDALARPAAGRDRARRADARAGRARGLPPPARRGRPHAGADAHRARRRARPRRAGWTRAPTTTSSSRSRSRSCGARLRALLRRTRHARRRDVLRYADLDARPGRPHRRAAAGAPVELTRTEFLLLELLLRHPRQVLTRTQIFEQVWGYDFGPSSNSLEVYVGYLRRKLRRAAAHPDGAGRRLRAARAVSFRRRLVLSCGAAVALVVVLGCGLAYWVVRDTLRAEIDDALRNEVAAAAGAPGPGRAGDVGLDRRGRRADRQAPPAFVTEIRRSRARDRPPSPRRSTSERLRAVAEGRKEPFFADRSWTACTCACTSARARRR